MAHVNHLIRSSRNSKLLAVYGGATRYNHCVLGDCLEGSSLLFIRVAQDDNDNVDSYSMTLDRQINLPSSTVFEGLSPIFIEDGATIITTVANSSFSVATSFPNLLTLDGDGGTCYSTIILHYQARMIETKTLFTR
mmetsp:Transcript_33165/g.63324  ORF Transcript_33165/g.63324 Transcript_33165/m.63324 type:complete len:136 (+) Transcript_33165:629-1036(+)